MFESYRECFIFHWLGPRRIQSIQKIDNKYGVSEVQKQNGNVISKINTIHCYKSLIQMFCYVPHVLDYFMFFKKVIVEIRLNVDIPGLNGFNDRCRIQMRPYGNVTVFIILLWWTVWMEYTMCSSPVIYLRWSYEE